MQYPHWSRHSLVKGIKTCEAVPGCLSKYVRHNYIFKGPASEVPGLTSVQHGGVKPSGRKSQTGDRHLERLLLHCTRARDPVLPECLQEIQVPTCTQSIKAMLGESGKIYEIRDDAYCHEIMRIYQISHWDMRYKICTSRVATSGAHVSLSTKSRGKLCTRFDARSRGGNCRSER